ncbi:MAG TPA: hypothetical protein VFA59_16515 [Vicinamibacterales bacterium]|nr:hypothetical protein [Vicinamibacterales bacterium]
MNDPLGADRYRRLFTELGDERARQMLDKLQIVALTSPETMRELESFLDRKLLEHQRKKETLS